MGGVVSVERVTITLGDGETSDSVVLSKFQEIANCVPFITKRTTTEASPADDWTEQCVDVYFSGESVYAATVNNTPRVMVVEIAVVEFDGSDVLVQQGIFQLEDDETSTTEALSPSVTQVDTFLVCAWKGGSSKNTGGAIRGYISDDDELTFVRKAHESVQVDGHWFTAESESGDFDVQEIFIENIVTSTTGTLSPEITDNKTLLVGTYEVHTGSSDDNAKGSFMICLTDTTTITVSRATSTGAANATVFAISFTGDEIVQRNQITGQGATAIQNVTIPIAVDLDHAMASTASGVSQHNAGFPGGASQDNADSQVGMTLTSITNLRIEHNTYGGEADNDISWQVVDWNIAAGGAAETGALGDGVKSGDAFAALVTAYADLGDGSKLGDSESALSVALAAILEGAKLGDTEAATAVTLAAISDGSKLGETMALAVTILVAISEGSKLGDTHAAVAAALASISEGAKGGDSDAGLGAALAASSEGAKLGDAMVLLSTAAAALSDGIKAGETWTVEATALAALVDGIKAGDSFSALVAAAASLSEGAKLGDTLVGETVGALEGALSEGTKAGESFVASVVALAALAEGAKGGETLAAAATALASLADGIKAGDTFAATSVAGESGAITEGSKYGETFAAVSAAFAAISEGAKLGEIFSAIAVTQASITDGATLGDLLVRPTLAGLVLGSIVITASVAGTLGVRASVKATPDISPSVDGSILVNRKKLN